MLTTGEKVMAIIIARGGSKSIPRKNVLPLAGKPLVAWPVDLAKSVARIDRVIISTDDDEIMAIAKEHGAEAPFKRPAELSTDEITTLPVMEHCLNYLQEKENYRPDIVLLLYPTAPYLKKERVDEALDLFEKTSCNSVISVVEDWGRFWRLDESAGKYLPMHPKERVNRQYYKPLYREDGAVYFNRYDVIMKQRKMVDENNVQFLILRDGENVDIDEPEDFKNAQNKKKKAIVILGGGLVNDNGQWRTTRFDEGDTKGALGDRLRVEAASVLFRQHPESLLIPLGGQGQYKGIPNAPAVAAVIKKELIELGVPAHSIITDEQSGNTWQQLQAAKTIMVKENLTHIIIVSNQYHLPRVQAMIETDNELRFMSEKESIKLISAESVLQENDPARWQELVGKAYQTEAMKNRIIKEEEGLRKIKSGVYQLK